MKSRASGILMHISSLPSEYGIGDFGNEAHNFIDFLVSAKQKYWQILPLGMTGFGDSPYQSFSAFAGNPYFIDLDELINLGYLTKEKIQEVDLGKNRNHVEYEKLYLNKMDLLREAYKNALPVIMESLNGFYNQNKIWLREFSLFMAIKEKNSNISWNDWPDKYRFINSQSVINFEKDNKDEIYFWVFTQYFFMKQWLILKEYANKNNIKIIGDLPIYVSQDSADAWANPKAFNLDEDLIPKTVSGCPPDAFTDTGQLWGNPIYNWENLEANEYSWWLHRIKHSFELFDTLRIDHFRGFDAYWEVPYGELTAVNGKWIQGPGIKFFAKIRDELGELDIIAEDLGFYTDGLGRLLDETGFPNMKVLQFGFDTNGDSHFLPHNYDKNCVAYIGTHDNYPAMGWLETASKHELDYAIKYLKLDEEEGLNWGLIRGIWSSTANLAIGQMQDFLGLGEESRMNEPSTLGKNWTWRIDKSELSLELANKISELTYIYRR